MASLYPLPLKSSLGWYALWAARQEFDPAIRLRQLCSNKSLSLKRQTATASQGQVAPSFSSRAGYTPGFAKQISLYCTISTSPLFLAKQNPFNARFQRRLFLSFLGGTLLPTPTPGPKPPAACASLPLRDSRPSFVAPFSAKKAPKRRPSPAVPPVMA